jgi:hypothetical protein
MFVSSLLAPLNNSKYSHPMRVALLPLQQMAHGILQGLLIYTMVSSEAVFQRSKQEIIWRCEVRTVWLVWQHCPSKFCDGLTSVPKCVWPGIGMDQQPMWHISCGKNLVKAKESIRPLRVTPLQSQFTVVPLVKMLTWITSLSPQKTVAMIFSADGALSNFFFLGDVMWRHYTDCCLDSGLKLWTQGTSPMTICNSNLSILYCISRQVQCDSFRCLFTCTCQHSWYWMSIDPGTAKLFSKCHYTAFTNG